MKIQKLAVLSLGFVSFVLAFSLNTVLLGASLTQDQGAIQINWSSQRFRSCGIAEVKEKSSQAIKKAEEEAMEKAYTNVKENLAGLQSVLKWNGALADFPSLKPSIYLAKTEYYDLNSVKIIVEARMSRLYKGVSFLDPSRRFSGAKNSGIIFSVDSSIQPSSIYTVYDESKKPVFSSSNVYASAFDSSVMGRWFKGRAGNFLEIEKIVGKSPVVIKVKSQDGAMTVSAEEWSRSIEGNESLLAESKIALIFE